MKLVQVHLYFHCIAEYQKILTTPMLHIEKMVYFYFFLYFPLSFNLILTRLKVITKFKKVNPDKEALDAFLCNQVLIPQQTQGQFRIHCSLFQLDLEQLLFLQTCRKLQYFLDFLILKVSLDLRV